MSDRRAQREAAAKEILAICKKYNVALRGWDDETVFMEDNGKLYNLKSLITHETEKATQGITSEKEPKMNKSILIFLIPNSAAKMVKAAYQFDENGKPKPGQEYLFKTFDTSLRPGDVCVVPSKLETRGIGFATVKVTEVDVEPDYDSTHEYVWIAGKVDMDAYQKILADEQRLIDLANRAEKERKKQDLLKKVTDYVNAEDLQAALPAPTKVTPGGDE